MTNWHLMIVGLLALVAAVLVGLNWTSVSGTADRETKKEQVETKAKQSAKKAEETRSPMRDGIQERCEKRVAKVVSDDVDKADIEDVCACAADEIHYEFEDELPDMMKSGADLESTERIEAIIGECIEQSELELQ